MSTQCKKCLGDGIIGNGENPHLKEGHLVTCNECGGSGSIADSVDNSADAIPAKEGILHKLSKIF